MAPLPNTDSSLAPDPYAFPPKLYRRTYLTDLPAYLSSLTLSDRKNLDPPPFLTKREIAPDSPFEAGYALRARDAAPSQPTYNPGAGAIPPMKINNRAMFALFALLAAALVLASIWFFFWAKNGGFRFRKGDWEDYKSTVLRRKGPDGKTLSNATKSTKLGGGSVVAETDRGNETVSFEKQGRRKKKGKKNNHDDDVRAYRHEKPAKVGGLNREADGFYSDFTGTDPSEKSQYIPQQSGNKKKDKNNTGKGRQFSYNPHSESTFSVYSDDSSRPLHSSPAHHNRYSAHSSPAHTPNRSRQSSPKKHAPHWNRQSATSMPGSYTDPIDFETRYAPSESNTEQTKGTKAYFHPIPGLSHGARTETNRNGFRRGGGRRRDSLSDSETDIATSAY
ncbi:hypothetical protein MMC20_005406 [Loxospora ochrophaea]|nr:hypothetical protein [Loxospora ochrophaea]